MRIWMGQRGNLAVDESFLLFCVFFSFVSSREQENHVNEGDKSQTYSALS